MPDVNLDLTKGQIKFHSKTDVLMIIYYVQTAATLSTRSQY